MNSISNILQPLLHIFSFINTFYLFAALCLGVFAAWSKEVFLYAICFAGMFIFIFSKFANFAPAISNHFNSLFVFLIVGYSASTGIKLALNHWRGY